VELFLLLAVFAVGFVIGGIFWPAIYEWHKRRLFEKLRDAVQMFQHRLNQIHSSMMALSGHTGGMTPSFSAYTKALEDMKPAISGLIAKLQVFVDHPSKQSFLIGGGISAKSQIKSCGVLLENVEEAEVAARSSEVMQRHDPWPGHWVVVEGLKLAMSIKIG
jgi:hypothetical protein